MTSRREDAGGQARTSAAEPACGGRVNYHSGGYTDWEQQ